MYLLLCFFFTVSAFAQVELGIDLFFREGHEEALKGKKIALVTNHTGVNGELISTADLFLQREKNYQIVALFSPEHGPKGNAYAWEGVVEGKTPEGIPIHSLMGETRRPTEKMLKGIDIIIYDIQDIGLRSYTYATTLYYIMEEAAKKGIEVIVLDRPNPIGGILVDGPMLQDKWRSFIGYLNVPYCHGMTIGELAQFFNEEYQIGCRVKVIAMRGWHRSMSFSETGLTWVPTSPYVPEADTPLFMASTGLIGELGLVNIGIGYTLPFKCLGAPWIDAEKFAEKLNAQHIAGVHFIPFHFRPFYGLFKGKDCHGVLLAITNAKLYRPLAVQYFLLGLLKSLYPRQVKERLAALSESRKSLFSKANGNGDAVKILENEQYIAWKLLQIDKDERKKFLPLREKYLLY